MSGINDTTPVIEGGSDGTPIGNVGDALKVIQAGSIPNESNFSFGDVTTAALTQVLVRRTAYTEPTSAATRSISSSNANDSSAGTGARIVRIIYYDNTGAGPFTTTVTLNGTTAVNTSVSNIRFIEHIEVISVGSTGSNTGILTLFGSTGGAGGTVGTVAATNNQTFWTHHYVPLGRIGYVTGISCSHNGTTVGSGGVFIIFAQLTNATTEPNKQISDSVRCYGQSSTFARNYASPIVVPGPARIEVRVTPETSSSTVYRASLDFYEI
jgi:hypothetical protein